MIIVTGANGHLGPLVLKQLAQRELAGSFAGTARDPGKASQLAEQGIAIYRADFADLSTLEAAFAGASQVLLVSVDTIGEEARRLHGAAIETARKAGVNRILYTSHQGAGANSLFSPMPDHHATEVMLGDSGVAWTSLRHGFYAASALHLMKWGLESGTVALPEDGKVSWTTHEDLAEADAMILVGDGRYEGPTAPLTAMEAFDMADLAAIASEVSGREIKREVISDDAFRGMLLANGAPVSQADILVGLFQAARCGEFEAVHPALGEILGRPAKTMREVLTAHLRADLAA